MQGTRGYTFDTSKCNGIVIFSKKDDGTLLVERDLMYYIPQNLRPQRDSYPRIVILITPHSKHVATRYGAGAKAIYDYCFTFEIIKYADGQLLYKLDSPWETDNTEFPYQFYKQQIYEKAKNMI